MAAALCVVALAASVRAHDDGHAPDVAELLTAARESLARGDGRAALSTYQRAAEREHAVDIELGIVRSQMQLGEYRHALAFAAHTASAHADDARGAVLYADLLQRGAQHDQALRVVKLALVRAPDDAALLALQRGLDAQADARWPAQPADTEGSRGPITTGDAVPQGARVAGTATLAEDGRTAWTDRALPLNRGRLWLRNGLGQTVLASVEPPSTGPSPPGAIRLRLRTSLGLPPPRHAARRLFAGAPVFVVGYPPRDAQPSEWPLMRPRFLGMPSASDDRLQLGDAGSDVPPGSSVFDMNGVLVGVAVRGEDAAMRLQPWADMAVGGAGDDAARVTPAQRMAADSIYEQALPVVLQVLVE